MTGQLQYIGINTNLVCLGISCGGYHLSVPPSFWVNEGNSNFWLVQFSIETATAFWKYKSYLVFHVLEVLQTGKDMFFLIIIIWMFGPGRERERDNPTLPELQLPVITWYRPSHREDNELWAASCKSANYIEHQHSHPWLSVSRQLHLELLSQK